VVREPFILNYDKIIKNQKKVFDLNPNLRNGTLVPNLNMRTYVTCKN
jgi:hypothetical protein